MEEGLTLLIAIEASKPDGTVYRMVMGWTLILPLASWIAGISRML